MMTSWRNVVRNKAMSRTTIILSLIICSLQSVEGLSITNSGDLSLFQIDEELPVGTVIITAKTDQPADSFELTDNSDSYLGINSTTGEVFIQKRIDKEVVGSSRLTATVTARKGSSTATARLTCVVKDINDVTPSFPKLFYKVSISEKTSVGILTYTVNAVDTEKGTNGQDFVTYKITSGNEDGSFSITQYGGEVKVSRELDYETKTHYTLNITARDYPGLSNWTILEITLLDADDLPAKFTAFIYTAEVKEDASLGTSIVQVVAFDLDKGINSTVTYGIDQVTNPTRLFVINNVTGMISLNGSLDRESIADYSIRVLAYSSYPVTDHATVNIKVTDANDNRSVFTQSVYQGTVVENLAPGTSVLKVEATDKDQGINAELRYDIKPGIDASRFSISHQTGIITTAKELDREEKNFYNLTVVVVDTMNATVGNAFNSAAFVYIYVQDANDNAPVFTSPSYNVTINESIAVGAKVIQVEAKDPDVDQDIVYVITGGNELSRFLIDRRSGTIYIRSFIDRDPSRNETAFTLHVMAIDDKNHLLNSTTTVKVAVDDASDTHPRSSQGFSITNSGDLSLFQIDEELPVGTVIITAITNPPADGFELTDNADGYFGINSTTGEVFIQKRIDKEVVGNTRPSATVTARRGSLTATASLRCTVRDINDVTPSFAKRFYNVSISEKTSVDNLVYTVTAVDTETGTNGQQFVTYKITSGNEDGSFSITQYGGEVKVSREQDYETKTHYTLNITARDKPGLSNWTILEITLRDADDLPAKFTAFIYTAEVSEDASLGTSIVQVVALDLDKGINSTVTYGMDQVTNPSRLFMINNVTGMISLNGSLDRESVSQYSIRVLAYSSYPVTDHATVNIKVTDANDNRPVFTQSMYQGTVVENLAAGTSVLKVEATDKDQGINAELRYHITPGIDASKFSVNHQTGVVSTATKLDREEKHLYNLTVVVEDMNGNSTMGNVFNNTATVYIHVQDANDNAPVFTSPSYNIIINESIAVGAKVIQVEAKDPDVDQDIVYVITGGNELSRFLIDRRSGAIYIRSVIDRDPPRNETAFTLHVIAIDDKNHLLNSTTTVKVVVDDVNDNQPHCSQDQYSASVHENATEGTTVMSLVCSDVDTGDNARLTYKLVRGADKKFNIRPTSGAVDTINALDYDNGNKSYKLSLLVTDLGNPPLSRAISLNIDVININDNSPVFKKRQYDFSVLEGDYSSLAVLIGKVEATDSDADDDGCLCGQIRYSIVNSTGVFSIDNVTGVVSTSSVLDRETKSIYTLVVMATDQDPWKPMSNITTVTIHVADQNDNSPIFDQVNYTAKVGEDKGPGYQVIKVSSSDRDSGRNANISYIIVSGNTGKVFAIDEMTGQISTARSLDYETNNRYELTVAAIDGGVSPRRTIVMVLIDVIDANDNKPVCVNNGLTVKIKENLPAGQIVTKISVVDKDHGINQKIYYSLVSDSFAVNHETGDVNTTRSLDRENQSNYTLTVMAYNYDQSSMTVNCTVVVVVEDGNDNPPLFKTSRQSVSVSESAAAGTTLLRVTATDEDEAYNGDIRYVLMGDGTRFAVNETTGVITLISSLDRETSSHYALQIVARDRGLPQSLSSMVHLSINVTDVNDNAPVFDKAIYTSSVPENAVNNTLVMTVSAGDRDEGLNKHIDYSITGGNLGNSFSINSNGTIMTATPLDRETTDRYELTITASDRGMPSLNSTVKAVITVLDVNDNAPNITNAPKQITIQENTPTGSLVYLLIANDKDLGLNTKVTYTGYPEPAGTFVMNPSTGMITTVGPLDRETTKSYKFHAYATDQGSPPLNSSIVSFDIFISDLNDNNPVFNPVSYAVNISEDVAIATLILRVNASEKDSGESGRIVYKIEAGDPQEYFSIDNTTGVIRSSKTLDRESIAQFALVISARDHGSPARYGYGYVTIFITDTNDLPPVFLMSQYFSSIKENVVIGTAVTTVIATDGDIGLNSKIMYSIVDGEGMLDFNITTVEELDPGSQARRFIGRINSARDLDRESRASYNLTVVASDGVHNSTTQVIITLQDVNDNPPIFDVSSTVINISLAENTPGGTKILNATACDIDEGSNARITYSVAADGPFYIDPNTGVLYTTPQVLDRETKDFYNLTITASDPGNNKASVTVNVNVLDVNDNPPQFNSSVFSITVNEGSSVMVDVKATDQDQGANQEIEYRIISGNDDGIFQIDNKTGNLTSVNKLDRERLGLKLDQNGNGVYSLVVEAADQGRPQLSSKTNVIITVKDVNDNAPVFQKSLYIFEISENASVGEILGSVKADDKDVGAKGQVMYSIITTGNAIPFAVNTSTGILSVNKSLDREAASSYEFKVQASDTGSPSLNDTATIKVVIKDINDNKPKFSQGTYHVSIPENTPGGSSVLKVEARDADDGSNGGVGYAILDGSQGHFIIEEWTGIIRTVGYLDYETNQSYTINVSASDRGIPSLNNSVLVFINISDINDHAPVFNKSQYSVYISEDSPVNTSVLLVQATDLDQGTNAQISYLMVDDFGVFSIDQDGKLSIKRQLDREEKESYEVQVKATDNGVPSLSSIALVKISVTDVNDNPPTFSKPWFNFQTSEDALNGAILGLVTAVDRDTGDNARLNYSLTGRKDLFRIDSHSGSLSLVHSGIGLANQNISLLVTCRDNGRPPLSSDVNVSVFISTGSRKVPKLVQRHLNVSIYENASIGDTIVKLNGSDTAVYSNIDYLLLAGGLGKFYLNSTNGVLTLTGRLDRETKSSYTLFVMIQDRTLPLYSDYGSVFIDILDINDNKPTFIQKPFALGVSESTANGSKVTQVKATDPDEGVNGEVFYFLQGDASTTFSINNRTGDVYTKKGLDYETTKSYDLTVVAENTLSLVRLRSLLTFTINVEDILDSKPTFPRDFLRSSIKEDAPIGSFVIDVNATLNDKISSYVFYRLMHNQSSINSYHFLLEPDTGIIRSQTQLDRETTSNYTLVVEARDLRGSNEYRATVHVIIDVLDVNDNDPVFVLQSYTFSANERSSSVGSVIGQIQARDADKDENAAILYKISDGNQKGYFGIHSSDGRLFIAKTLDFESQRIFTLKVRAYDKQKASLGRRRREVSSPSYSEATVTVQIQDENDNPPVFTQQVYVGHFYPETSEGTVLVTVKAIDNDSGTNSIARYYTTNESLPGVLSLKSSTGHVTHNKSILNDTITSYSIQVSARDNNGMAPYNTAIKPATVMILYLTSKNAITLVIGVPLSFVNANRQQLENLLSNVTGQRVILKSLKKSPDDPSQTIAVVHLVSNNSMSVIKRDEAIKILSDKSGELETRYPDWKIRVITGDSTPTSEPRRAPFFSFYIAAIMVFAVLIGIVGLIGIIVICRYKQREKKYYDPDCQGIAMDGIETNWYSIDIPGIGAYIESRADPLGTTKYNGVQDGKSNHHKSTNEENDGPLQGSLTNDALASVPLEEEPTITSVLSSPHEARGSQNKDKTSERDISSKGNPGNTSLNENQSNSMESFKNEIVEANDGASTGSFLNKAYESEDGSSSNHTSQSETPNSLPNLTFVTRKPFTTNNTKGYLPNMMGSKDDLMDVGGYGRLNGRTSKKRSDSYSPADYQAKNNKIILKNGQGKDVNFPRRSSFSISGIYDIQKRREQQRKKKRKRSSHVRFDLEEDQHPDELEWERQVSGNRTMPTLGLAEGEWSDAEESLEFHTFGRTKNESKTDDSPDSSISDGDDCEVLNLTYSPSDYEDTTTYVINPELKTQNEAPLLTQL